MSKSGANVLLIFQCPVICPTPSQVDIIVSNDSPAFSPAMYNKIFTWVETRAKSELIVRLVPTFKHVEVLLTVPRRYGAAFVDRISCVSS